MDKPIEKIKTHFKKHKKKWITGGSILGLLLLALAGFYLFYYQKGQETVQDRPLVMILTPSNNKEATVGQGVLVNAVAESKKEITQIELWVDGELKAFKESEQLHTSWDPLTEGDHLIVVRAKTESDVYGQSTAAVKVLAEPSSTGEEESEEKAESEAGDGAAVDEGDDGTSTAPTEAEVSAAGGAPEYVGTAPEESYEPPTLLPFLGGEDEPAEEGEDSSEAGGPSDFGEEPYIVELTDLETNTSYESVHCYIGINGGEPLWYPDTDGDQTTNESFSSTGSNHWNIDDYLAGTNGIMATLAGRDSLDVDAACIGIRGGGTDAVELGRLQLDIPEAHWDGAARRRQSETSEGYFILEYKVGTAEERTPGIPLYLDPEMTPPTNLHFDERRQSLKWDYSPEEDEAPIDGFRIFLNGTPQWEVGRGSREARIPHEWMFPACGVDYTFSVTAFRGEYVTGPESSPTLPPYTIHGDEPGSDSCGKEVLVTFKTFTTGELQGDGRRDPADVGPIMGTFYANREFAVIDGRCGRGGGCSEFGFNHHTEYQVSELLSEHGSVYVYSTVLVELDEDEDLTIGYEIMDDDTGRNPSDLVCDGELYLQHDRLDHALDGDIRSEDSLNPACRLSYSVRPAFGSPIGAEGDWTPLPQLRVTDITVNEETNIPQIHVSNIGTATWASHHLEMQITAQTGDYSRDIQWINLTLEPGETKVYESEYFRTHPPLNICVLLDPNDNVLEMYEESGAFARGPYCPELPDLEVLDVRYDSETQRLFTTIQNASDGVFEAREIDVDFDTGGGRTFHESTWTTTLEPWETRVLTWTDVEESDRTLMQNGYTVSLDPDNNIAETNESNNEFDIPRRRRIRVKWTRACIPFFVEDRTNHGTIRLNVEGQGSWSSPELTIHPITESGYSLSDDYTECWRRDITSTSTGRSTEFFFVAGDERLEISTSGTAEIGARDFNIGERTEEFNPAGELPGTPAPTEEYDHCSGTNLHQYSYTWRVIPSTDFGSFDHTPRAWTSSFVICREGE